MKTIEKCSCAESQHLRKALKEINRIAMEPRVGAEGEPTLVDDITQIANLADQGRRLKPLDGDPMVAGEVRTRGALRS